MIAKLSQRLNSLLASEPNDRLCSLHVMLKPNLDRNASEVAYRRIGELSEKKDSVKPLPRFGIVTCTTSFSSVADIADLDDVVWLDLESEAPIEDLLDGGTADAGR